jgi:hypothetical protein
MDNPVQIKTRVQEEFRRRFRSKCAAEGKTVEAVLKSLLEDWLEGVSLPATAGPPKLLGAPSRPPPYRQDHRPLHDDLEEILEHGTPDDRNGIKRNLEWAVTTIRSRAKDKKKALG